MVILHMQQSDRPISWSLLFCRIIQSMEAFKEYILEKEEEKKMKENSKEIRKKEKQKSRVIEYGRYLERTALR